MFWFTVRLAEVNGYYKVSVVNPGESISEEDHEVIWDHCQGSQHQGGRRQGTGIGLAIVSSILKAHEIQYGVECADGETIFWFAPTKAQ